MESVRSEEKKCEKQSCTREEGGGGGAPGAGADILQQPIDREDSHCSREKV